MSDSTHDPSGSVRRLRTIPNPPLNEEVASIVDLLQEHLKLAREGRLRSVAVVSVSENGEAIGTQWSCAPGDLAGLVGMLTVLTHDIMAARR